MILINSNLDVTTSCVSVKFGCKLSSGETLAAMSVQLGSAATCVEGQGFHVRQVKIMLRTFARIVTAFLSHYAVSEYSEY